MMTHDPTTDGRGVDVSANEGRTTRFLGSLKDALNAASREEISPSADASDVGSVHTPPPMPSGGVRPTDASAVPEMKVVSAPIEEAIPSAGSAAKAVRGTSRPLEEQEVKLHKLPTTRVVKAHELKENAGAGSEMPARTQLVRGKSKVARGEFEQDPVVGWLVVVGGPGIGKFRPIFEGNNAIGRGVSNRVPIDFGDEAISSEEQAYIRYDSSDRSFLFVPNLAKTNVVSVNNEKPTGAVALNQMDVIMMGRTQLVFVPFCGAEFDWSALGETTKD